MTLDAKERGLAREWEWPARLGAWLGRRTLADLVLEAVRKVDGGELNPPVSNLVDSAFHPKAILAMLTYCYADGVYGSEEAECLMHEDSAFRALCGLEVPDWRQLRRFRRHNHTVLSRTLGDIFQQAWRLRFGAGVARDATQRLEGPRSFDCGLTPLQSALVHQEVENRIERAMFIDQIAAEI